MINGKIIKVCGMKDAASIQAVEALKETDWMGFIFYPPSPRYMAHTPEYLPSHCRRTGVFVNASSFFIRKKISDFQLEYVQLHGTEPPSFCLDLRQQGIKVIKTVSIASSEDLRHTEAYEGCCDYFLFDTRCAQHGGSGRQFDWNILHDYHGATPFLLSGGIAPDDTERLNAFQHPLLAGYDLNSKFEDAPGVKNVELLRTFFEKLKNRTVNFKIVSIDYEQNQ